MKLRYSAAARDELAAAMLWYERERQGLGLQLRDELREAAVSIQRAPLAHPLVAPGVRRRRLRRFPYAVFYRLREEAIDVVAIAHDRRQPGYWAARG